MYCIYELQKITYTTICMPMHYSKPFCSINKVVGLHWKFQQYFFFLQFNAQIINFLLLKKVVWNGHFMNPTIAAFFTWTPDVTWIILMMSLLRFWTLIVLITLLSMEGSDNSQNSLKYLNLCSEDERRSDRFGTTWGWVINDIIFIFGWTKPFISDKQ